MASWMNYITGRRDTKASTREAIVTLRQQISTLQKKADHLQKQIDGEVRTAKANAIANKALATDALRKKRLHEKQLDQLSGQRLQLEMHLNTIESANLNAETMRAMKKASEVLKQIHGNMTIDQVDETMEAINAQKDIASEIAEAISSRADLVFDEEDLQKELEELESEELNDRLVGADHAPIHSPAGPSRITPEAFAEEAEEETQLKELQESLAAM